MPRSNDQRPLISIAVTSSSLTGSSEVAVAPRRSGRRPGTPRKVRPIAALISLAAAVLVSAGAGTLAPWRADLVSGAGGPVPDVCDVEVLCPAAPDVMSSYRTVLATYVATSSAPQVSQELRTDRHHNVVVIATLADGSLLQLTVARIPSSRPAGDPSSGAIALSEGTFARVRVVRVDSTVLDLTVMSPPGRTPPPLDTLRDLIGDNRLRSIY